MPWWPTGWTRGERGEILWDDELTRSLADFQKTAVRQAIQIIRDQGGAFVSDVVGLGKSYVGAAVVKHFVRTQGAKPLIICPKTLEEMWQGYDDEFALDAKILPMSMLKLPDEGSAKSILDERTYKDRDFVLIDESHNFRHHSSQRYEVMADFLSRGLKKVCLLTATPRNRGAGDVYNQIKLFHQDDITQLPIDPPNLKEYFELIEKGQKRPQDLLVHILIRRTRRHILRWYGYAADTSQALRELSEGQVHPYLTGDKKAYVMVAGRHQYFPRRELETLRYSIEEIYDGLYERIRRYLGRPAGTGHELKPGSELTYARYGLWNYVRPEKQKVDPYQELHRAGINLRGLIRVMLFKRFESSVHAFRKSLERLERIHGFFLYENMNPGGVRRDIEFIYGTEKSKARMAARFSPHSNPHLDIGQDQEVDILVATDVMSEGLNLQDGDVVVNYDLHWNPVRLIQRFGRIDRIGTENERVWGFNFLPELRLERNLGLQQVLRQRIQAQVVKLEEAFKGPVTAAIRRQLNTLRRNGVVGSLLLRSLTDIYHDHGLHEQAYEDRRRHEQEAEGLARIICSEAFV